MLNVNKNNSMNICIPFVDFTLLTLRQVYQFVTSSKNGSPSIVFPRDLCCLSKCDYLLILAIMST